MSTNSAVELTTLLSTPTVTLVYAIPLLLVSVLLTFAGTFLTLDRTRSFPPKHGESDTFIYSYESFERRRKTECFWWWRLEGGLGGLAVGFAFGAHLATLLALIVPNISTSGSLSPSAFLAVYFISAALSTIASGRYRVVAIVFTGLASGVSTSMALSIMLHPSLLGRRILLVILTILTSLPTIFLGIITPHMSNPQNNACLAYLPSLTHPLFRFCTASTGSFGLIISIALLLKPPAKPWANVWERLWVSDGIGWGTGKEKGLTAAWVFFTCLGILEDWALRKWFGDNPDQKWDDYLSSYVHSLPYNSNRAGTFKPLPSLWDRLFHTHATDSPSSFSPQLDAKLTPLLTDDDPIPKSAIPDPFYADTPPPISHFAKLGDKHKLKSDPFSDDNDDDDNVDKNNNGASDDSSDGYDLPAFIKKRRKKGRFGKLRLRLYNPDNSINSRPVDAKGHQNFGRLGKAQADKGGIISDDTREAKLGADHSDNLAMSQGRYDGGDASASNTVSSSTIVGGGSENTRLSDRSSEVHTGRQANKDKDAREPKPEPTLAVPAPTAPDLSDYSDYEVDLTSLAPSPLALIQDRKREQMKGDRTKVPQLMERRKFVSTSLDARADGKITPGAAIDVAPTATDRARARVRAFVSGAPVQVPGPTRRSSFPILASPLPSPPVTQVQQHRASPTPMTRQGLLPPDVSLPASVPATPSLLNALRRVAAAQQQAYGLQELPGITSRHHDGDHGYGVNGLPIPSGAVNEPKQGGIANKNDGGAGAGGWDDFWKDVKAQARAPTR